MPLFLEQPEIESITNSLVYETEKVEKALRSSSYKNTMIKNQTRAVNINWKESKITYILLATDEVDYRAILMASE